MRESVAALAVLLNRREDVSSRRSELVVIEREGFTTGDAFAFEEPGRSMPIDGPGTLVNAVLVAESSAFDIFVDLDGQHVIDTSFATLQTRASELERIAAYERSEDGNFVFAAANYEFQKRINVVIQPRESITFPLQRAEVDVIRED